MSYNMGKFELTDKKFHDYNNGEIRSDIKSRNDVLQVNPYINYDTRSDYELLGYLSNFLVQKDSSQKPELSFLFKLWRFLRYFRWSNKYYKSGGGKIADYRFYTREIQYHLKKLTKISYLSSHEIRQLISASLRIYFKNGWDEGTPLKLEDLHRCKNLQEFYTSEFEVDFKFADKLENLRIVDLYRNSADNKRGIEKFKYYEKRNIKNLNFLQSCLVLNLEDSYVDDFKNIKDNILTLSVKNSNFEDLDTISHLNKLQYLDFSENQLTSLSGIQNFKDLKVLNCCKIEFTGEVKSKIVFFSLLNELKNLELLVMDSKLYEEYKVCVNILPPEKLVIVYKSYSTNVKLETFEIIKHYKIAEQLNKKITLSEIDFEPIKEIFIKKSK